MDCNNCSRIKKMQEASIRTAIKILKECQDNGNAGDVSKSAMNSIENALTAYKCTCGDMLLGRVKQVNSNTKESIWLGLTDSERAEINILISELKVYLDN